MLGPDAVLAGSLATSLFHAALAAALAPLTGLPGLDIVPFDAAGLFAALITSPSAFGLANVTDACVMPNDPPFVCANPDEYLFWDGVHPTAAVHAIIAEAVAAARAVTVHAVTGRPALSVSGVASSARHEWGRRSAPGSGG